MQVSSKVSRVLRVIAPLSIATSVACATASYENQPDLADSGGNTGILTSAGNPGVVSAGAGDVAGAPSAAGSPGSAGSPGAAGAPTGAAGAPGFGGSPGAGGGASHAGAPGSAGSTGSGKCTAAAWVPTTAYRMGDKATKSGKEYTAAWYTMADPDMHCCGNGQDWVSSVTCN